MTTYSTRKVAREIISAKEYLKRRKTDPKSVEGARMLIPTSLGARCFGMFRIKRDVPHYEILPARKQ